MDFDRNEFNLSALARKVLDTADKAINLYTGRNKTPEHIVLFPEQWNVLNRSLVNASDGRVSLRTHTYRGIWLVGPPKGWSR